MKNANDTVTEGNFPGPEWRSTQSYRDGMKLTREALVDINPDRIASLTRIGDRLILLFQDGIQLTIDNFFRFEDRYQRSLKEMSADGDIWPALDSASQPEGEIKYNFSQPATACVFSGSAILVAAVLMWIM